MLLASLFGLCAVQHLLPSSLDGTVHLFIILSSRQTSYRGERHMFVCLSWFLSLCSLPCSNLREGKETVPVCAPVSLHAASRQMSVCCTAPTPGKYPAEPHKRRLSHCITSERQKLPQSTSVDQEMSCMQNMVSAQRFSKLFLTSSPAYAAAQPESVSVLVLRVVLL